MVDCSEVEEQEDGTWVFKLRATAPLKYGSGVVELAVGKPVVRRLIAAPPSRLTEHERRALAFWVPGPASGYSVKPPAVTPRASIYTSGSGSSPPKQRLAALTGMSSRACGSPQGICHRHCLGLSGLLRAEQISQAAGVTPLLGTTLARTPRRLTVAVEVHSSESKPTSLTSWFDRFFPTEAPASTLTKSRFRGTQTVGSRRNLNTTNRCDTQLLSLWCAGPRAANMNRLQT